MSQSLSFLGPDSALPARSQPHVRSLNLGMELLGFETGLDDGLDAPPLDTGRRSLEMARSAYTPAAGNGNGLAAAPLRPGYLHLQVTHHIFPGARFSQRCCTSAMIRFPDGPASD